MENQYLLCECRSHNVSGSSNVTWQGQDSQTWDSWRGHLELYNVQRADNGTQYTCVVTADGVREEAVYTLCVAYGPFDDHMSVGPSYVVSNGSQPVTLTCNATNVYPTPAYTWHGINCEKQTPPNTCTFTPDPATDDLRNVTCTAVSRVVEEHYHPFSRRRSSKVASRTLQMNLLYKVAVESLTLNDTDGTVTVNGDDQATLRLVCRVYGRPVFTTVTIAKDNITFAPSDIQYQTTKKWYFEVQMTLSEVQCRDIGDYTCTADYGHYEQDTKSIQLNVRCPPTAIARIHENATDGRMDFTLEAYPVPKMFVFVHFGNQMSTTGTVVSSDKFAPVCQQEPMTKYMVKCRVTPRDAPSGFYRAHVYNSLGTADFSFSLENDEGDTRIGLSNTVWPVTGGCVALFLIVVVGVVAVIIWKRRAPTVTDPEDTRTSHLYVDIDNYRLSEMQPPMPAIGEDKLPNQTVRVLLPPKRASVIYQNVS